MSAVPVIAIDGPAASGKGTVARRLAEVLGFHYLESGALYRLVALDSLRRGVGQNDEPALAAIATGLDARFEGESVLLGGVEVGEALRSEEIGNRASAVAGFGALREALLARQRAYRQAPGLVCEGRDMGTVVFPDAGLKVFYVASVAVRAERRYKQLKDKGIDANLSALSRDLAERDARDASRSVAPLVPASDAVQLDSSDLSVEEVVAILLRWYRERTVGVQPPG
jgi:cytidylate kinase